MPNEILNCLSDTLDTTFVNRWLVCALPAVFPSGECDEASALEKKGFQRLSRRVRMDWTKQNPFQSARLILEIFKKSFALENKPLEPLRSSQRQLINQSDEWIVMARSPWRIHSLELGMNLNVLVCGSPFLSLSLSVCFSPSDRIKHPHGVSSRKSFSSSFRPRFNETEMIGSD